MDRKRKYAPVRRSRSMLVRYTEDEYGVVADAAGQAGLAPTSYVAEAALAAARDTAAPSASPLRDLAIELMQARRQVRRFGVNVNQAVAKLHATGEVPVWLAESVERCDLAVAQVDTVAAAISRLLR
jgi:uncharacterized protein (DUF1778 family)